MTRVYTRTFDWDEARRLRASGLTFGAVGELLGVSATAVQYACDEEKYERSKRYSAEWLRNGQCRVCGGQATRRKEEGICRTCSNKALATSVRENTLRCADCREWKPDDAFPLSQYVSVARRGRRRICTPCETARRRDYRHRNREKQNAYDREYKRRRRAAAG